MSPTARVTVITDEFIREKFERVLAILAGFRPQRVNYIDIRDLWGKNIVSLSDSEVSTVKRLTGEKGFHVACIASPCGKTMLPSLHPPARENVDKLGRALQIAQELDALYVRIFAFKKPPKWIDGLWREVVDEIVAMGELAQAAGKILVIENEGGFTGDTMEEMHKLIEEVRGRGVSSVQALLDPGNLVKQVGIPLTTEALALILPEVGFAHIKDVRVTRRGRRRFGTIGEGIVDYPAVFKHLREGGYEGFFSLETHMGGRKIKNSTKGLRNLMELLQNAGYNLD